MLVLYVSGGALMALNVLWVCIHFPGVFNVLERQVEDAVPKKDITERQMLWFILFLVFFLWPLALFNDRDGDWRG